jgi:hypothetical protein
MNGWVARKTLHNGTVMRSRLEASFAALLDGIVGPDNYEYEPFCFSSSLFQWLPDFRSDKFVRYLLDRWGWDQDWDWNIDVPVYIETKNAAEAQRLGNRYFEYRQLRVMRANLPTAGYVLAIGDGWDPEQTRIRKWGYALALPGDVGDEMADLAWEDLVNGER